MTELSYGKEIVISSTVTGSKENIAPRRTVVYKTLIDPAIARIVGEKNKHRLFRRFLFKLNNPKEVEFVSIEKYYEPFVTVSGKYMLDYYRKCAYTVRVDREVTEVILFNNTFIPQGSNSPVGERNIRLKGEERLIKNTNTFLFLNRSGHELRANDFPPAPSEENPQEMIESFKMPGIFPDMEVDVTRKRIAQRPGDINRIVTEQFEIDERSVIYRPIFKVTYKSPKLGKEAYLKVDGITSKLVKEKENILVLSLRSAMSELKETLSFALKWTYKKLQRLRKF